MSLFTKLFEAVHSWRRRRGGYKSRKRTDLAMEQLDHRQLLAVNFTGNVPTDFPVTESPGVVEIPNLDFTPPATPVQGVTNTIPQIPGKNYTTGAITPNSLASVIPVSGFQINSLSVSYDATTDILSVGVEGPPNGVTGQEVIAGDSDDNLNSGTVNPSVTSIVEASGGSEFLDTPDMGGRKTYSVFFEFNGATTPQVVAGFPITAPPGYPAGASKPFEVAGTDVDPSYPGSIGYNNSELFPQYTGNYYLVNDPNHPNFEFQIDHFSQLYQQMTGEPLSATSTMQVGADADNPDDGGITDEFFPAQTVAIPMATVPTPPPPPVPPPPPPPAVPECSPTIYVNPHENNHVNTAHPTAIRVNILGSSGFDPTTIIPSTVRFGDPSTIATTGAPSILNYERNVNHDEFPDETFVFNGLSVSLPSGVTTAEITGETTSGMYFSSQVKVFNRDDSYYTTAQINKQQAKWLAYDKKNGIDTSNGAVAPPPVIPKKAQDLATSAAIDDLYGPFVGEKVPKQVNPSLGTAQAASLTPAPVVSIPTKHGKASKSKSSVTSVTTSSPTAATSMSLAGSG
jgi:hypothetical protein